MTVRTHAALKKPRKSLEEWKEVITLPRRIPLQLTRPGQFSSGCKRTFQSSSLLWIGPQEALISALVRTEEACHRAHSNLESLKQPSS
ncbi:unnamed protein product [Nezara viridula]|uniref:Uncharacterized protein n=1 Tax=Nezara viridula TaxID=85310 RepID=A0A9P0H5X9_NEZVI|nr:unnamed protein product [Nezara viridula]